MSENKAVQVIERGGHLPTQQATTEQWAQRRQEFNQWVTAQLKEGIDYGKIPGIDKDTLFKPGAEKIAGYFGCLPNAIVTFRDMNPETGYLYIEATLELINIETGIKVGAGLGSCSTMESKYRWRKGERTCPHCGKVAIIKGKDEFGGGWLCWTKRDGCGAKFKDGDPAIEAQVVGRIPNTDLADQWNTVIKMAKKRAFVDAALAISGASERFTQDVEDMPDGEVVVQKAQPKAAQPQSTQSQPEPEPPAGAQVWTTDKAQTQGFMIAWKGKGLSEDEIHLNLNVTHLADYKGTQGDAAKILQTVVDKKAAAKKV